MMATNVVITDDFDGSPNAETIEFSFDGANYSIDLVKKNRTAFEKALRPYLQAATPVPRAARGQRAAQRKRSSNVDLAAVRAWAAEQGIEVSARGRIAQHVIDAYQAAR